MDLAKRIQEKIEADLVRLFYSGASTNAIAEPQEPITADSLLASIQKLRATMPKLDQFLSTRRYPIRTTSLRIEGSDGAYIIAHPDFWARLRYELSRDRTPTRDDLLGIHRPLFGIEIVELDGPFPDTEVGNARRRYVQGIWEKVVDAINVASVELPEWLKAAPTFTAHQ